jgi:hypothetical protein
MTRRDDFDQQRSDWRWDDLVIAVGLVGFLAACALGLV